MAGCRLIINVDDFGLREGVNQAVCRLHDAGIVTSASLMVAGAAVPAAVAQARARPELAVGLHVAVVAAQALLPREELSALVDPHGWFTSDCVVAALRYTCRPACRQQLRPEIAAQFATFRQLGLPWSHVDTHRHFGLTPVVSDELLRLCSRYGVRSFRIPEDDYSHYRRIDPEDAARQRSLAICFSALCTPLRRRAAAAGLYSTTYCLGLFRTGRLDVEYLRRLVEELPDGDYELHCHPDADTERGVAELAALASPEFSRALRSRGVGLTTYPQLAARERRNTSARGAVERSVIGCSR